MSPISDEGITVETIAATSTGVACAAAMVMVGWVEWEWPAMGWSMACLIVGDMESLYARETMSSALWLSCLVSVWTNRHFSV